MNYRFRAQAACRIAGIDRDRFNEAVAAGNYPCAPPAVAGSSRVFDEDALCALFYYGRMLGRGYPPSVAGNIACLFQEQLANLRRAPDELARKGLTSAMRAEREEWLQAKVVVISATAGGRPYAHLRCDVNLDLRERGYPMMDWHVINIEEVRRIVRLGMAEEANVLGEEDDETSYSRRKK